VPPRPHRELRDLTRQRSRLVGDKGRVANLIQKVVENANVKLASVAADPLDASGRDTICALIEGRAEPAAMAQRVWPPADQDPAARRALAGRVSEHHRFMLRTLLEQLEWFEGQAKLLDESAVPPAGQAARRQARGHGRGPFASAAGLPPGRGRLRPQGTHTGLD
jgi:transposase